MLVDAYKNVNDDKISVRSREIDTYGEVVDHRESVIINDAEFVVQPAGRDRVREEERKNVHAFVRGELEDINFWTPTDVDKVVYDPYEYDSFVLEQTEEPVTGAERALVRTDGVWAVDVE